MPEDMAIKGLLYEHDWIIAEPCRKRKLAQDVAPTENWILPPVNIGKPRRLICNTDNIEVNYSGTASNSSLLSLSSC